MLRLDKEGENMLPDAGASALVRDLGDQVNDPALENVQMSILQQPADVHDWVMTQQRHP